MYFLKGERYPDKEKTIQEWMERDSAMDKKLENATEPCGVCCINCSSSKMKCVSRDLMNYINGKDEVVFMFECEKCGKRRACWENGKEWESKPNPCSKCNAELGSVYTKKNNTIKTVYFCSKCEYKDVEILDLVVGQKEGDVDPNFEANRIEYCLSIADGLEYSAQRGRMDALKDLVGDWEEKNKNKELYDVIEKIRELTIIELEKLLVPILDKAGYVKLQLLNPEIEKDVVISFGIYDRKVIVKKWVVNTI